MEINFAPKALAEMKKVYKLIFNKQTFAERSLAGICYDLGYDYRKKKRNIIDCIDNLCELGFQITERDTENNEYFGILISDKNAILYDKYFINIRR